MTDSIPRPTLAAERMRLHRQRRRKGLRCFSVELRETEVDRLVNRGLLMRETRQNYDAVLKAFYAFLDRTLV